MNQQEHKERAEYVLRTYEDDAGLMLALVHAVLALVPDPPAAVGPKTFAERYQTADGLYCSCSRFPYQHPVNSLCGATPMPPPGGPMISSARAQDAGGRLRTTCCGGFADDPHVDGCEAARRVAEGPGQ